MPQPQSQQDDKRAALRVQHALNRRPEAVSDPVFRAGAPFFDPRDLVQVKYEMLRRVQRDGEPVNRTAAAFGFSRPAFYQAQAAFDTGGLPGLVPQKPGPRRAHKLTEEILNFLDETRAGERPAGATDLAERLKACFGITVHPRSIERALARRRKKGRPAREPEGPTPS